MPSSSKKLRDRKSGLPSPKGHWLWGHLRDFKRAPRHLIIEDWAEKCEAKVFKIRLLHQTVIVSIDPDLNEEVLKNRPNGFRRYHRIADRLEELGVVGAFSAEGEQWYKHRKIMSNALTLKKVKGFYPEIKKQSESLVSYWKGKTETSIDVQADLTRFAADVTAAVAFGVNINRLSNKKQQDKLPFERIFPAINERIASPIPTWKIIKRRKDKKLDEAINKIKQEIFQWMSASRVDLSDETLINNDSTHFLAALIEEQRSGEIMNDAEIMGNVFTVLMAGQDTTANTLSWCLYYLAQYPDLVRKIREENKAISGSLKLPESVEELSNMSFTAAFIKEVLRLKPVSPNLFLEALEAQEINGVHIRKGSSILLQNRSAQRDSAYFKDADEMAPQRWLKPACPYHETHDKSVMKPFGSGVRFCPGMNLAQFEIMTVIIALCQSFDMELAVPVNDIHEAYAFTMHPKGLQIRFKEIGSA